MDYAKIGDEAVDLLRRYLTIDTTNPPGNEIVGARFLAEVLDGDGIESEIVESGPGRANLRARLAGDGSLGGILLHHHMDVVYADRRYWTVDPFGGEVRDGYLYGRGALDMKGMGIMELVSMVLAKRHRIPLDRDLVFVAVADEEEGGIYGVHHLAEHHADILQSDYVFNEGAYGFCEFMGREAKIVGIAPSEKSPCWLRFRLGPRRKRGPHQVESNALKM